MKPSEKSLEENDTHHIYIYILYIYILYYIKYVYICIG